MYRIDPYKRKYALKLLGTALSPTCFSNIRFLEEFAYSLLDDHAEQLPYHGTHHSRDDVMLNAISIAVNSFLGKNNLAQKRLYHLTAAAVVHDIGNIEGPENHEERSIQIFENTYKKLGFTLYEFESIAHIVRATDLSYSPQDPMQKILRDADLGNLGEHFLSGSLALLKEQVMLYGREAIADHNREDYERGFLMAKKRFIEAHDWLTTFAGILYGSKRSKNIEMISALLDPRVEREYRSLDGLLALPDYEPPSLIA